MPKKEHIKKVLVIGSGPIIIGQAAEFDYSGTQACKSLKEEGVEVVLINSNPATIMTDKETADKIYIEPITLDFVKKIIEKERPQGVLASLGGQTGLNMAIELSRAGILEKSNIEILGTSLISIKKAEDRELFKATMQEIGEKVPDSTIVTNIDDGLKFVNRVGFPIIIRPAYTLGGSGGGIVNDIEEFKYICGRGLKLSLINQVLLEQSVAGWKEIEYEVMRDSNDNAIIVCNMENVDPVGVHTGDSIVVAPSQTLSDIEYQMLRSASIKIIRTLKIEGGCNIQFALNPNSFEYVVIEVNPRVSRSSALASKATGYPIARVAAKIALGYTLDEIKNSVTQTTYACFEPSLDYVVTKIPRWPFDKFSNADRRLGTQMKATGEVMAIGRTFEESLLKAIDSLDINLNYRFVAGLYDEFSTEELIDFIKRPNDQRIFMISELLERGITAEKIVEITKIDIFFIKKLEKIVDLARNIRNNTVKSLSFKDYKYSKQLGFSDEYIASLIKVPLREVSKFRKKYSIKPIYKIVDTCAGEFEAVTPYYYSTHEENDEVLVSQNDKVIVLGSGPIRIGQGIEFDYCSVHSVKALKQMNFEAIIINNNPETVSTDFDISDKLYFEPLTKERVLDVILKERPIGVITQFGGQTAINLANELKQEDVKLLGTSIESIDIAEDREKFLKLLEKLEIHTPEGMTAFSVVSAKNIANKIGYPVLVRPSYVLGGRAMEIVCNDDMLETYMDIATKISKDNPVLIDKYIYGKELEIDGICDGQDVFIPGIMEHIERSGIHSGDSIAVYPPQNISDTVKEKIIDYTCKLGRELKIKGIFNIQFIVDETNKVYVIEVNPRASRTIPIMSKVTGIPMVNIATNIIMGRNLHDMGYRSGLAEESKFVAVKVPVFSFSKLTMVDTFLGPEMKSTGEVLGIDKDYHKALYKALVASGFKPLSRGVVLMSIADNDKKYSVKIAERFKSFNYRIVASEDTCRYLMNNGINAECIDREKILEDIKNDKITLIINTPTVGKVVYRQGFILRRTAMEYNIPCITSIDTALAILEVLEKFVQNNDIDVYTFHE